MKQVIVMRNDLNMRKGKMIAQGAHASIMFLQDALHFGRGLTEEEQQWVNTGYKKVCVRADSIQELLKIHLQAKEAGLKSFLILDEGHTEFGGVATHSCLAIGPHSEEKIDKITGSLKLL